MNFKEEYKARIKTIDDYINNYLSSYTNAAPGIVEAMKYSVLNGGKRLRSILCTEVCVMLGGTYDLAIPYAASIELIHAYSLVHDDLPSMDNADYRRGQLSCHKKYGEAIAVLCGDALLNSAYELMANNCTNPNCINAMQTLAASAGIQGMISGQVKDLKVGSDKSVDKDTLIDIIEQKTMAIIKSAIVSGSQIANADLDVIDDMEEFAYHLGLAFQIRDDFEDIAEDEAEKNDSPNFINALGEIEAKRLLDYNYHKCINIISEYKNNDFILNLLNFLFK